MSDIYHLREKVQQKRSGGFSWNQIARSLKITTPDGKLNPRLAQMIFNGYEPKKQETRKRLGLPPICITCYRRIPKPVTANQLMNRDIVDIPTELLRVAFKLREELK